MKACNGKLHVLVQNDLDRSKKGHVQIVALSMNHNIQPALAFLSNRVQELNENYWNKNLNQLY